MEKQDALHIQILKIIAALPPNNRTGVITSLIEPLKNELTKLVSVEGFDFLFERSVFLTCRQYSWLDVSPSLLTDSPLSDLKIILEQRELAEAREASTALLRNFIDLVASLIGELLLIDILRLAWGNDALGSLGEESNNE